MTRLIHVAAGVVLNERKQVLLALRPKDKHKGGLWEFPGGKVEPDESVQQALARELEEEINLVVLESSPFLMVDHDYGDKLVRLDVWLVTRYEGLPQGREGQEIAWADIATLPDYAFPEANVPIVDALLKFVSASP